MTLTAAERVLLAVQAISKSKQGEASTSEIIERAWDDGRGLTYDQTNRWLRKLVDSHHIVKTRRGFYRPIVRSDPYG